MICQRPMAGCARPGPRILASWDQSSCTFPLCGLRPGRPYVPQVLCMELGHRAVGTARAGAGSHLLSRQPSYLPTFGHEAPCIPCVAVPVCLQAGPFCEPRLTPSSVAGVCQAQHPLSFLGFIFENVVFYGSCSDAEPYRVQ